MPIASATCGSGAVMYMDLTGGLSFPDHCRLNMRRWRACCHVKYLHDVPAWESNGSKPTFHTDSSALLFSPMTNLSYLWHRGGCMPRSREYLCPILLGKCWSQAELQAQLYDCSKSVTFASETDASGWGDTCEREREKKKRERKKKREITKREREGERGKKREREREKKKRGAMTSN